MSKGAVAQVQDLIAQTETAQTDIEDHIDENETQDAGAEEAITEAVDEVIQDTSVDEETDHGEGIADDSEGEETTGEAEDAYTVSSLAEAIGWEPGDLYNLVVPMGDEGEPVTLGAIKDELTQARRDLEVKDTAIKSLEEQAGNVMDMTNMGQGVSHEMIRAFSQLDNIQHQYQAVDWAAEEQKDPGNAALLRQKFQEAFQQGNQAVQVAQQKMQAHQQQVVGKAAEKMLELMPEWKSVETRRADQGKIRTVMKEYGYSDQIIDGIKDPHAMHMLREFVNMREKLAEYENAGAEAIKKVRKAPKVIGTKATKALSKKEQTARKIEEARTAPRSRRRHAETDAVKSILANR